MDRVLTQKVVSSAVKSEIIKNTMLMLLAFFEDCEKKGGTVCIRPHAALDS